MTSSAPFLERGSPSYWRASLALLFAGYSTFSLLYCVQPLLPAFSTSFGISPAQSSLAVSATTASLALAILAAGFVSEGMSRHRLMTASLIASSLLTLATAAAPQWSLLLVLRALEGVALGGVPAVAMAYLAEEVHPDGLGLAMGLYIGGTAIGGMTGRVLAGVLAQCFTWRIAIAAIGLLGLLSLLAFRALLPPSRHFVPRRGLGFAHHRASLAMHFANPPLRIVFAMGFVLMGSFVMLYNYVGYRLLAPPYGLDQAQVSAIFVVYLAGVAASPLAGRLADALGRARVLGASLVLMLAGVALTLCTPVPAIVAGITCITVGFFAGHALASGWVGRLAPSAKGQAAALYLLSYYLSSSLVGWYGGHCFSAYGWRGVAALAAALLLAACAGARWLRGRERAGAA